MMKDINQLALGFSDAENYQRREHKSLFNSIFVKNIFLDDLLNSSTFFLIGEKGTGKTAYSVYLSNNEYKNNVAQLKYIRETDYQKFVVLKQNKHLELSDYNSIWKVIILLLLAKSIKKSEVDYNPFSKNKRLKTIMTAVNEYYQHAFSPEIVSVLNLVENCQAAAEIISKHFKLGGEEAISASFQESKFQVNLLYLQHQLENALRDLKLKSHHLLFIDGIDIRPGTIPYKDYLDCVKGLAGAVWDLNIDFFANIKDAKGRFRCVLLVRPDIFNSIGLQNLTNKVKDNSVFLDWRTTYPNYRNAPIFELSDKLLRAQQKEQLNHGQAWDFYFPWESRSTSYSRDYDPSFYKFLRYSYSRPRDIVTIIQILQEEFREKGIRKSFFP
ncbi:MAG: funZ protein, partial [Thermotogota bacterium]|nr:funZ protein [Thermotogota bacterium]